MSDFSGLEQSFALPAMTTGVEVPLPGRGGVPQGRARSYEVQLEDVEFRRLHAADEIHAIRKMRSEIQLPGTAMAEAGFMTREKKETRRGW